jgi:hypothetical protein
LSDEPVETSTNIVGDVLENPDVEIAENQNPEVDE